jgi:hypothetical protein
MLDRSIQIPDNLLIFLLKSDFHKINDIIQAKDKTYEINVCSKPFFFSKEQIILFSVRSFNFILETKCSFNISAPFTLSDELVITIFKEIFLLFSKTSEIVISQKIVFCFQYLSEVLENADLCLTCEKVKSSNVPQHFFNITNISNDSR